MIENGYEETFSGLPAAVSEMMRRVNEGWQLYSLEAIGVEPIRYRLKMAQRFATDAEWRAAERAGA